MIAAVSMPPGSEDINKKKLFETEFMIGSFLPNQIRKGGAFVHLRLFRSNLFIEHGHEAFDAARN